MFSFRKNILICLIVLINFASGWVLHKQNGYNRDEMTRTIRSKRSFNFTDNPNLRDAPSTTLEVDEEVTNCFEEPKIWCNTDTKYRTIDGQCNNLRWRTWGMANTALNRLITAAYKDDFCTVSLGRDFPTSTKLAEFLVHSHRQKHTIGVTKFFALFAVVIADDVSAIDLRTEDDSCCADHNDNQNLYGELTCSCMITNISELNSKCMKKSRTRTTHNIQCPVYPVNQMSTVSSFLDASFLYSSNKDQVNEIRSLQLGKLKTIVDTHGRPHPECFRTSLNETSTRNLTLSKFHSHIGAHTINALFHRLHNFLCDVLSWLNPSWNDEKLFEEAKRLLIALYQNIVYSEFIPVLIGYEYADKYHLMTKKTSEEEYNPKINPSTINSFTTVAFRIFHFLYPSTLNFIEEDLKVSKHYNLLSTSLEESDLKEDQNFDKFIQSSITETLFENSNFSDKLQLFSLDIERARDHGLPSYTEFREVCELPAVRNFDDLKKFINSEDVFKLAKLYKDVDDIELYVAGILEKRQEDAVVGPTFQCIIGEAFYRYKYGDRFFYEHQKTVGQFTKNQLEEIKKVTASLLICISSNAILKIQSNVFHSLSHSNPEIFCETLFRPDYSLWQELTEVRQKFN